MLCMWQQETLAYKHPFLLYRIDVTHTHKEYSWPEQNVSAHKHHFRVFCLLFNLLIAIFLLLPTEKFWLQAHILTSLLNYGAMWLRIALSRGFHQIKLFLLPKDRSTAGFRIVVLHWHTKEIVKRNKLASVSHVSSSEAYRSEYYCILRIITLQTVRHTTAYHLTQASSKSSYSFEQKNVTFLQGTTFWSL
jgi:hypothetical protein